MVFFLLIMSYDCFLSFTSDCECLMVIPLYEWLRLDNHSATMCIVLNFLTRVHIELYI